MAQIPPNNYHNNNYPDPVSIWGNYDYDYWTKFWNRCYNPNYCETTTTYPSTNYFDSTELTETDKEVKLVIEMAGVKKEFIEVTFNTEVGLLKVSWKNRLNNPIVYEKYVMVKDFTFSKPFAMLENGILTVTIEKKPKDHPEIMKIKVV